VSKFSSSDCSLHDGEWPLLFSPLPDLFALTILIFVLYHGLIVLNSVLPLILICILSRSKNYSATTVCTCLIYASF